MCQRWKGTLSCRRLQITDVPSVGQPICSKKLTKASKLILLNISFLRLLMTSLYISRPKHEGRFQVPLCYTLPSSFEYWDDKMLLIVCKTSPNEVRNPSMCTHTRTNKRGCLESDGLSLNQMNCHLCPYTPAGNLIIGHDCPQ